MGVEQLLNDLKRSHEGLQHLHIDATEGNLNIILDALTTMKTAYSFITSLIAAKAAESKETEQKQVGDDDA